MGLLRWMFGKSAAVNTVSLTNVEQRDGDTHANLWLQREWIQEEQTILVTDSGSRKLELKLYPMMTEGFRIRLKGRAFEGGGDLLLLIRILK